MSKRDYRGINYALLSSEVGRRECPYFATKRQIYQIGGKVKDGEWKNYSIVTFWKLIDVAGRMIMKGGIGHAFVWSSTDGIEDLGQMDVTRIDTVGIKDFGQVVGVHGDPSGDWRKSK